MEQILESGAKTILLHKENLSGIDFSIIYNTLQKDPCNSEKEAVVYIYRQLRASEPPDEATARDVIEKLFFSDKRYDLGDVGRYRINKKLDLDIDPAIRTLTRWINRNSELYAELLLTGYHARVRTFMPRQVGIIVRYLNEP